jgi:hypothetical protein
MHGKPPCLLLLNSIGFVPPARTITIDTRDGDSSISGIQNLRAVGYAYAIGKYDVTNAAAIFKPLPVGESSCYIRGESEDQIRSSPVVGRLVNG